MVFSSLTFLFFFFPVLFLFYFVAKRRITRNTLLLFFSLFFYAWGEPRNIFIMLLNILIAYFFGIFIDKFRNDTRMKSLMLLISLIFMLSFLIYYKYANFFIKIINQVSFVYIEPISRTMPIGISFFTFQAISYLVDLYRGDVNLQKNILHLALYISLFPQLVAGPIVRYTTVENEIVERTESLTDIQIGLKRFIIGLSKKVLIANQLAIIPDTIYQANRVDIGLTGAWIAALGYTFQIYFDFSGYSDMAIGLGKVFGFNFLENFNYPYYSTSVTDFWRRWHISLSSWFRDYVYIPLGGNRVSVVRHIINILIVWILTGFWHGANYNFLLWGLYFGMILIFEKYFFSKLNITIPTQIRRIATFLVIVIGWVIFRVEDFSELTYYISAMFSLKKTNYLSVLFLNDSFFYNTLYILPAIYFSMPHFKRTIEKKKTITNQKLINLGLILLFGINIIFIISSNYNPFIYFRF